MHVFSAKRSEHIGVNTECNLNLTVAISIHSTYQITFINELLNEERGKARHECATIIGIVSLSGHLRSDPFPQSELCDGVSLKMPNSK